MKHLKCLLLLSSLMICNVYGAADGESKPDETRLSTHFKLGTDPFDATVVSWRQAIAAKCLTVSELTPGKSNLYEVCLDMCQENLNVALLNLEICARAKGHYAVLQENSEVVAALTAALAAKEADEDKVERAKKWKLFRQTTARKLQLQEQAAIPGIKYPDPGSKVAVQQWATRNADLVLNKEQINQYLALQIVLCAAGRQVHRKCDLETDDPNLLLHKDVTD